MKHLKPITFFFFCLHITFFSYADKIEKKGTILNANCNPIGTNCKATSNAQVSYTYVYNEPRKDCFSFQIHIEELAKIPSLQKLLLNKTQFYLAEALEIPDDIAKAFHLPTHFKVTPGLYPVRFQNNCYLIIFKD